MTPATKGHVPATYQLRVEGHLDQYWAPWFGDLTLTQESDGTTSLTGVISDQAELHGMLIKIRDLGVTLISVALVEPHVDDAVDGHGGRVDLPRHRLALPQDSS
jgi:hypothetical protein